MGMDKYARYIQYISAAHWSLMTEWNIQLISLKSEALRR